MVRGPPSLASRILEDLENGGEEGPYLVLYDFKKRPSNYFYKNLRVIQKTLGDGIRIQVSVIQCRMLKTAMAIEKLAEHYHAEALVFRVEPWVNPSPVPASCGAPSSSPR